MSKYHDRVIRQSLLWVNGKPEHNHIDGECCIDFSCCNPDLFTNDRCERERLHKNLIDTLRGRNEESRTSR